MRLDPHQLAKDLGLLDEEVWKGIALGKASADWQERSGNAAVDAADKSEMDEEGTKIAMTEFAQHYLPVFVKAWKISSVWSVIHNPYTIVAEILARTPIPLWHRWFRHNNEAEETMFTVLEAWINFIPAYESLKRSLRIANGSAVLHLHLSGTALAYTLDNMPTLSPRILAQGPLLFVKFGGLFTTHGLTAQQLADDGENDLSALISQIIVVNAALNRKSGKMETSKKSDSVIWNKCERCHLSEKLLTCNKCKSVRY